MILVIAEPVYTVKKPTLRNRSLLIALPLALTVLCASFAFAQLPPQQWLNKYGGSQVDIPLTIKFTNDGGTIIGGYTDSRDGDIGFQPNREYWDLWVLKLDRCGNIQWERSLGGTGYESARDIIQTTDGGYLVLGETNSTDGGVIAGFGGTKDIWLIKFDASGVLQWQKRIGGSGLDIGNNIVQLSDGNFFIAASTSSNDGDVSGNHGTAGYTDALLMKIDPNGNVLWKKCFGGSKNDELLDLEIINGRIYAAGYANSTDGDIPPSQKNYDVWLLSLDQANNKVYSKIYGGSQNDVAYSITRGLDGNIALGGYTTSNDGDVTGSKGSQDFWVLNISTAGDLRWQTALGGSAADYANSIITDSDGGYLISGISYSQDGDVTASRGEGDYWIVKLTDAGTLMWKQNIGGRNNDHLRMMIYDPALNEYYVAGDSDSDDGDFPDGRGETDFTIIKYKLLDTVSVDSIVCTVDGFVAAPDTLVDVCGNDSAIVNYRPVELTGPFHQIKNIDTIFSGGSIELPSVTGNITWNHDPTLSCTACPNPVASPTITTVYTATNSIDHCRMSGQFTVVVLEDAVVHVPNAFTPNGDGLNDWFGALGKVPEEFKMQIYNRDGNLVFQSSEIDKRWDGRHKGKLQTSSVYVYLITYKDRQNKIHQKKGTVVLIR